jgi:hypothetical protein
MIHKLVSKDLASNAAWSDHPFSCRFQRLRQHGYLSTTVLAKYTDLLLVGTRTFPAFLSSRLKCETGGMGNANFLLMPLIPSAKIALNAKNGFKSAPVTRISKRVPAGGTEGGEMTLTEAVRAS